ncbi:MAG TPA: hypothetical protein VL547_21980 [Dinghuibacter sp.]|uniref:hypothetical protein n=1 Tax=Dinghuibacter sp. TaxID=2024697 RepID=UPI002BE02E07|nr:hypothetical protein [Dinghuibacter sp.]HTJ14731.1 hypothetical protein [Dinghuibacter sp.]
MEPILFFILLIVGLFLFRLIAGVVLPVVRTAKVIRREFEEQARPRPTPNPAAPAKGKPNWDKMGDYIDFEEVK